MQSLPIEPGAVRGPGTLQLRPIEINRYATPFAAERARRGDPALVSGTWS